MVITMAKLCMAHASTHGARKPPGPKKRERLNDGDNNGQATQGARKHAWRTQAAWAKSSSVCVCQNNSYVVLLELTAGPHQSKAYVNILLHHFEWGCKEILIKEYMDPQS